MTLAETIKMTAEQYLQLGEDPPGVRLELVDGEIIVSAGPSVPHAYCVSQLLRLLGNFFAATKTGVVMSGTDHVLTLHDVRRPDVYVFRTQRLHLIGDGPIRHPPDLAVEVVSPGSDKEDRIVKFEAYRAFGIPHYWIIDPTARTLHAFHLDNQRYLLLGATGRDQVVALPPFEGFTLSLRDLWWPPTQGE